MLVDVCDVSITWVSSRSSLSSKVLKIFYLNSKSNLRDAQTTSQPVKQHGAVTMVTEGAASQTVLANADSPGSIQEVT